MTWVSESIVPLVKVWIQPAHNMFLYNTPALANGTHTTLGFTWADSLRSEMRSVSTRNRELDSARRHAALFTVRKQLLLQLLHLSG